jgi:hypothetical protein
LYSLRNAVIFRIDVFHDGDVFGAHAVCSPSFIPFLYIAMPFLEE